MLRESTELFLAEYKFSIDHNLKNAASTFDETSIYTELIFKVSRQTGGLWGVVSLHTVFNTNIHLPSPSRHKI